MVDTHLEEPCLSTGLPLMVPSFIRTIPSVLDSHQFLPYGSWTSLLNASPPIGNWLSPHPAPKENCLISYHDMPKVTLGQVHSSRPFLSGNGPWSMPARFL